MISTDSALKHSAGVVVVRKTDTGWCYLLLRAFRYWDFPKGEVDTGETPFHAAVREVREETGIDDLCFPWGEVYTETEPYRGGRKVARYYLGQTQHVALVLPVSKALGRAEHHEYRWLSYHDAYSLLVPRVRRVLGWADQLVRPKA